MATVTSTSQPFSRGTLFSVPFICVVSRLISRAQAALHLGRAANPIVRNGDQNAVYFAFDAHRDRSRTTSGEGIFEGVCDQFVHDEADGCRLRASHLDVVAADLDRDGTYAAMKVAKACA